MSLYKICLFIFSSSFLSSCMSYQYVALKSDLAVDYSSMKYFTESDSVKITYDFHGEGLPVVTSIYNFTSADLYVDLRNSVYAENGRVTKNAVGPKTVQMSSVTSPDNLFFDDGSVRTDGRASTSTPPEVLYIPPGMYVMVKSKPFSSLYKSERKKAYNTNIDYIMAEGRSQQVNRYDFETDAREFSISFRVSANPNLSQSRNIKATFQEDFLYNSNSLLTHLPGGMPKYYFTSKKNQTGAYILLGGLAVAGVYAIVTGEDE